MISQTPHSLRSDVSNRLLVLGALVVNCQALNCGWIDDLKEMKCLFEFYQTLPWKIGLLHIPLYRSLYMMSFTLLAEEHCHSVATNIFQCQILCEDPGFCLVLL